MELVFMLEELSMKRFLEGLLPRLLPGTISTILIPHEGKSDLEKSLPRKLKAWRSPNTFFVVIRDQDSSDCRALKQHLQDICASAGRGDTLVRIACRELESWVLGDLRALEEAFEKPGLARQQQKAKFRDPDALGNPLQELQRLVPEYQKVSGAQRIGAVLDYERCTSTSLKALVEGLKRLTQEHDS